MRLLFLVLSLALAAPADWVTHAEKLSGHPDPVREEALRSLRAMKGLEGRLIEALKGPHKYLALDVLSALSLKGALDELIRLSEYDENGAFYLALNTLIDKDTAVRIQRLYEDRLRKSAQPPPSIAAQVVLLDTLGRFGSDLPEGQLLRLMESRSPEVRSAVLYFVRLNLRKGGSPRYRRVVEWGLKDPAPRLRLQTRSLLQDLPAEMRAGYPEPGEGEAP